MKAMNDRKMDMKPGQPDSDGFFPAQAEMKNLGKIGQIKDFKYPDKEEIIKGDMDGMVKAISNNEPKKDFRH